MVSIFIFIPIHKCCSNYKEKCLFAVNNSEYGDSWQPSVLRFNLNDGQMLNY